MTSTPTRQHPDQTEAKIVTVTLPNGKTQEFQFDPKRDRVYAGTSYVTTAQFAAGLDKMRAAGATVVESIGYIWE